VHLKVNSKRLSEFDGFYMDHMICVCHATPTQNGFVCMCFVRLGHHDVKTPWAHVGKWH